MHIVGFKL